jgi:hypothetical protein
MAKHRMTVEEHYSVGRVHPRGRVIDEGAENSIQRSPSRESATAKNEVFNRNTNQSPEDFHDRGYNNDHANDWVRGGHEDATTKPGFDKSSAWRQPDGSIHGPAGDHREQFVKPGSEAEFEKRRK